MELPLSSSSYFQSHSPQSQSTSHLHLEEFENLWSQIEADLQRVAVQEDPFRQEGIMLLVKERTKVAEKKKIQQNRVSGEWRLPPLIRERDGKQVPEVCFRCSDDEETSVIVETQPRRMSVLRFENLALQSRAGNASTDTDAAIEDEPGEVEEVYGNMERELIEAQAQTKRLIIDDVLDDWLHFQCRSLHQSGNVSHLNLEEFLRNCNYEFENLRIQKEAESKKAEIQEETLQEEMHLCRECAEKAGERKRMQQSRTTRELPPLIRERDGGQAPAVRFQCSGQEANVLIETQPRRMSACLSAVRFDNPVFQNCIGSAATGVIDQQPRSRVYPLLEDVVSEDPPTQHHSTRDGQGSSKDKPEEYNQHFNFTDAWQCCCACLLDCFLFVDECCS